MFKHLLEVKKRDLKIKNAAYRRDGLVVANLFGEGESQAVLIEKKALHKLLPQVSESAVVYLQFSGQNQEIPAMIYETQKDVITGEIIHVSLRRVNLKNKVTAPINIEVSGVFGVPEAVYLLVKDEVEAQALPTDLPEKFVVDLSTLTKVGQQITFADLDYDRSKIKLLIDSEQEPIVVVDAIKVEEESTPVVTEETSTPTGETSTSSETGESNQPAAKN